MAVPTSKDADIDGVRIKASILALLLFTASCNSQTMVIEFPSCTVVDSITQDTVQVTTFDYSCP
jgi:2-methylaconitate cis-trans-isomerase PrpF